MRKNILKNLPEKILSLVLAITLYLYVYASQNPQIERDFTVKLEVKQMPANFTLTSRIPSEVKVRVGGLKHTVGSLSSHQIKAYLSMANVTRGDYSLKIITSIPREVSLKSVKPENVEVSVDEIISSKMKVECVKVGTLAENYFAAEAQISPPTVEIKGAAFKINSIKKVVVNVNVSNLTSSVEDEFYVYPLDEDNAEVKNVMVSPRKVYLRLKINPLVLKEVKVEAQILGKPPLPYKIKEIIVIPNKIFVKIPDDKASLIHSVKTEPLNLSNITSSETKEIPLLKSPDIFYFSQGVVRVEIYLEKLEE